jgi:tRNA(Ile)-lysidine synthase TilS/MesJ
MCKLCNEKPVYEFTNKRKLCKNCFVDYFHKKLLYTIRKFGMIRRGDVVGYKKKNNFKGIVLEQMLIFLAGRAEFKLVKLPRKKTVKIAVDASLDSEAGEIVKSLIKEDVSDMKKFLPVYGNVIKPLYLFLDEEILLYAKLTNLRFKQKKDKNSKIEDFMNDFEKKHPEVKRAIVNSLLELYK